MKPTSGSDSAARLRELRDWLNKQKFPGVTGFSDDDQGLRIYVNPAQFQSTSKNAIDAKAAGLSVTYVETSGPIKFL